MTAAARVGPLLQIRDLHYHWPDGTAALQGCNLELAGPGLWMLVGSNGSGKSTLLRILAGLLAPSGGDVVSACTVALVFQNPDHQLLLPSCGSDLRLSLPPGLDPASGGARISRTMARVGLAGLEDRPIHTLSGGQKQRLAIAGALISEASLLLLDEPTALLDPISQGEILDLMRQLTSRPDAPLAALWITHRLEELEHCDAAVLMDAGRAGPWQSGQTLRQRLERG